ITPIPTNRDQMSQFVRDIQNAQVEPIQPQFLDYQRDLTVGNVKKGLPLLYKKNVDNQLFNLVFRYDFGQEDDNRYGVASDYLDYVGTDQMTAADIKQQFYKLACNYSVNVNSDNVSISLSGLSENMEAALKLVEHILHHAKADQQSYSQYVDLVLKDRDDAKKNQRTCFNYLYQYGVYGPYNPSRHMMSAEQLRSADPQQLLDLLKNLGTMEHTVLYYGPMTEKQLSSAVTKLHKTPKHLAAVPQGQPYTKEQTPQNEVWLAPYDAKNIYMRMYNNEGRDFNPDEAGIITLFNEYFGGGMNGIVFQEMREARGLAYNASAYYARPSKKGEKESFFTHIITQNDKM
ncbi:MAG: insulinase family protein, partial [Prevotella sp.]|nr:insulinase family protein [Prevotella sp.]